jgi:ATP-binding cassette subfamily C protein
VAFGRRVCYLPQSVVLLDGTIMENISRFEDEAPAVAVDAATGAGVHDLIGRLPEGYATWIGGNGYALSGGQRQRVALARALYGNPGILILDEPNANLDHDGELALVETVRAAKRAGAAVLLITHRPTILKAVDRVITVQDGRIAPDAPNAAEVVVSPVSEGEISAGATVQLA